MYSVEYIGAHHLTGNVPAAWNQWALTDSKWKMRFHKFELSLRYWRSNVLIRVREV